MGQKEKLIARLLTHPKDFTFSEIETLLRYFAYKRYDKGRTSGSRVMFINDKYASIMLYKPHQRKELLDYQIKQVIDVLKQEGLI